MPKLLHLWSKFGQLVRAKSKRSKSRAENPSVSDPPEASRSGGLNQNTPVPVFKEVEEKTDAGKLLTPAGANAATSLDAVHESTQSGKENEDSIAFDTEMTTNARENGSRPDDSITNDPKSLPSKTELGELGLKWEDTLKQILEVINDNKNGEVLESEWVTKLANFKETKRWDEQLKTPAEVIHLLESPQKLDSDTSSAWETTKSYAARTLECIRNLGGLVAKDVSAVFPQSEICFSVLCYLLETAKKYHEYFNSLDTIFKDIIPFLHRFQLHASRKSYGEIIDSRLKDIMHRLLEHFVWACCHAITVMRSRPWEKTKIAVKILFFRHDGGVREQIELIKRLVSDELHQSVAVILDSVLYTQKGVKFIAKKIETQETIKAKAETSQKHLTKVESSLMIREPKRYRDHLHYPADIIHDTGSWLIEHESFCNWYTIDKERNRTTQPVIALEAPSNYGKTYLCSKAIRYLRMHYRIDADSTKAAVAYFHFEKNEKNQKVTPYEALKYIIWQLCDRDLSYRKHVADVCESRLDFPSTELLWRQAIEEYQKPATFFIILDGIEKAAKDREDLEYIVRKVASLSQVQSQLQIRLLLAGPKSELDKLQDICQSVMVAISVSGNNQTDVSRFIQVEMDNTETMKGWSEDAQRSVQATLSESPGDFIGLRSTIRRIKNTDSLDEIEKILRESIENNQGERNSLEKVISRLEKTLDETGIKDLNEILPWIVLPEVWPSLQQINAVLDLRRGVRSVMDIKDRIRTRYPEPLLEINDGLLMSMQTLEYFTNVSATNDNLSASRGSTAGQDSNLSLVDGEGKLRPSVVTMVKDIVRAIVGAEHFEGQGFDELISNRSNHHVPRIIYETSEGHGKIIHSCLKSFCTTKHKKTAEALHQYTADYLGWHLEKVDSESLKKISSTTRRSIGGLFHKLLTDDEPLGAWLKLMAPKSLYVGDDDSTRKMHEAVLRWCKDPEVLEGIEEDVRDLYQKNETRRLMNKSVDLVAKEWLQNHEWDVSGACAWLLRYATKRSPQPGLTASAFGDEQTNHLTFSIEEIRNAGSQACDRLSIDPVNATYMVRISETLLAFGHWEEAVKESEQAKVKYPKDCRVLLSLSRSQRTQWPKDAYQTLKDLKMDNNKDRFVDERSPIWIVVLRELGDLAEELEDMSFAVDITQQILKLCPSDLESGKKLVHRGSQAERSDVVFQYLRSAQKEAKLGGSTRLQELLAKHVDSSVLHYQVSLAAIKASSESSQQEENLKFVASCYEQAEKNLEEDPYVLVHLRYYHGLLLQYQLNDMKGAIKLWDENTRSTLKEDDESLQELIMVKSAKKVLAAYFETWKRKWQKDKKVSPAEAVEYMLKVEKTGLETIRRKRNFLIARMETLSNVEESAMKSLKPHIQEAKTLLTDDDPDNDWFGYYTLAEALSFVDKKNALIAWSLITPNEVEDNPTQERKFYSYGPLYNECDGDCGHHWTYPDDMYVCRDCIDVQLETNCFNKLIKGELESRVCGKDHEFLHVPSWDEKKAAQTTKNKVILDDGAVSVKTWLGEIWRKYSLD